MQAADAAGVRELEDPLGARVDGLVHRMAEAGQPAARGVDRPGLVDRDRRAGPPRPRPCRGCTSRRAHGSAVPRITGPAPRIPAATAPCSESGSAASVIRAATFVGIIPCSAIATSSTSRKKRCSLGRLLAGEQEMEVLAEAEPSHQLAAEIAPAHLDPVGIGLADVRDGPCGVTVLHTARNLAETPLSVSSRAVDSPGLLTVTREWGRIGFTGFGGPPAHIALLRRLCVERRGWIAARGVRGRDRGLQPAAGPGLDAARDLLRAGGCAAGSAALVGGLAFIAPGPGRDPRARRRSSSRARRRGGSSGRAPVRARRWRRSRCRPAGASSRSRAARAEPAAVGRLPARRGRLGGDDRAVARARAGRLRRSSSWP